jgi:membrane associated rhomboid family serine protease
MAWHSTWNRPPERTGFFVDRGGMFPPGVKLILILTVGVFLLEMVWGPWLIGQFSVTVEGLLSLQVWRLVTYMFLHASADHILWNMFVFWMLGAMLERQLGTKPFLTLYFACGVAGGLFEVGFNALMFYQSGAHSLDAMGRTFLTMPAVGASAGVAGVLVAFATLNPRAQFLILFLIPVEAWLVALVYALVETRHVFLALWGGHWDDNVAHAAHVGGMVLGFLWIKWGSIMDRIQAGRPEFRVVRDVVPPTDEEEDEEDRILQKIHDEGLDSLSVGEKMYLQEMTRRRQGRM